MTTRRGFITGLVSLVAAPAIVRASSLMPVKSMLGGADLFTAIHSNLPGPHMDLSKANLRWFTEEIVCRHDLVMRGPLRLIIPQRNIDALFGGRP